MADRDTTLLAHLSSNLRPNTEVAATKALVYILNSYDPAMAAFNLLVEQTISCRLDSVEKVEVEPTYTTESGARGRPDFVGFDNQGKNRIVGEAKFDAAISLGQGGGYLHQLAKNGDAVLMFVVPDYRLPYLWGEVSMDVKKTSGGAKLGETKTVDGIRTARVEYENNSWHLMMISWLDLLAKLREKSTDQDGLRSDIHQLEGLAKKMDKEAFLPLHKGDLGANVARRLLNLTELIDTVVDAYGVQEKWLTIERNRATATFDGYGRYFAFTRSGVAAWFGFSYGRWADSEETPLWFALQRSQDSSIDTKKIVTELQRNWKLEDDRWIPFHLKLETAKDEVFKHVVAKLQAIDDALGNALAESGC